MTGKKDRRGGRRKGAGRKKGDPSNRGAAPPTPEQFMRSLVPAGPRCDHNEEAIEAEPVDADFTKEQPKVDPVEFCLAIINNDRETLMRCGVIEVPDVSAKLMAAKVAIPYTNKRKPVEVVSKHQFSWADEMNDAERRIREMRMEVADGIPPERVN